MGNLQRWNKHQKLGWIGLILVAGFAAAELRNFVFGVYLGRGYPWNTYLFTPSERFSDYTTLTAWCADLNPYFGAVPSGQLPFLNFAAYLFSLLNPVLGPALYFLLLTLPFFIWALKSVRPVSAPVLTSVFAITFLNYPLLFTADRGNFEAVLFFFLLGTVYLFSEGRYRLSAAFLGISIALKGFPIVFLPLFAFRKRYLELAAACVLAGLLSMASLALFEGGLWANAEFFFSGKGFDHAGFKVFLLGPDTIQRGVSLFSLLKIAINYLGAGWDVDYAQLLKIYKPLAAALFLPLLWLAYVTRTELWKSVAVVVVAAILLPQLSGHYKLIYLLIPAILFVKSEAAFRFDRAMAVLFGLLLIPKPYFMLAKMGSEAGKDLSIAVILDPVLMGIMLLLIYLDRKPSYIEPQQVSDM